MVEERPKTSGSDQEKGRLTLTSVVSHHRRSVRLNGYDYARPGAYFVTLVTHRRSWIFGHIVEGAMRLSPEGKIAEECWRQIPQHFPRVELGAFVVMPNHIHGILVQHEPATVPPVGAHHGVPLRGNLERFGGSVRGSLASVMRQYKSSVTRHIIAAFGEEATVWQRGFHDHVVRDEEDWNRVQLYIEANPGNWETDEENPAEGLR